MLGFILLGSELAVQISKICYARKNSDGVTIFLQDGSSLFLRGDKADKLWSIFVELGWKP